MLQLKKIHKQYKTGDLVQTALDKVSLLLNITIWRATGSSRLISQPTVLMRSVIGV